MLLKAEGVGKAFGPKEVLKDVDIQIELGDRIGLVGRNGAGKTTLIKLLMGRVKPDVGTLNLRTSKISYLSQFVEVDHSSSVDSAMAVLSLWRTLGSRTPDPGTSKSFDLCEWVATSAKR